MKCKNRKHINPWIERKMGDAQKASFETHLEGCGFCQKEVIAFRKLNELLGSTFPALEPSPNFERMFWQKIIERQKEPWWAKASRTFDSWLPMPNLSQALAVLVFALIIGGASGALSAMNALTSEQTVSSRVSVQYLSGFREFNGVPSTSITGSYLEVSSEKEAS
jgi:hypothetical protein